MPHDNFTYNHLPYGEYARSAYDGMQNLYGDALDNGMNSVIDYVNPKPDMMSEGPMSRNTKRTPSLNRVRASLGDNEVMPLAQQRYLAEMDYNNSPLTEAEMGSSPVQELDTGPFDLDSYTGDYKVSFNPNPELPATVAKKGPLVRGTYDDYISERDSRARLNSKLEYERMQKGR